MERRIELGHMDRRENQPREEMLRELLALRSPPSPVSPLPILTPCSPFKG